MRRLLLLLPIVLAACSPGSDADPCAAAVVEAAAIDASSDTVEDLDDAIRRCESVEEFTTVADSYPDALDGAGATTFLTNRCQFEPSLGETAICQELKSSATVEPSNAAQGYVDHFVERSEVLLNAALEPMQADELSGDLDALAASAQTLESLGEEEVEWLDSHPSLDCYAQLHANTREAYALFAIVGAKIREAADAGDVNAAGAAAAEFTAATNTLDLAIAAVPDMVAACGL